MYIYIHIPFCKTICSYCDFPKVVYCSKFSSLYLDNLECEIKKRYKGEEVKSIFIGGGTPTSLNYNELEKLLLIINTFNKNSLVEFTVESNVDSLDIDKIRLLKKYGVNRISLGVQSFDDDNLRILNRTHKKENVFNLINLLKSEGFANISIDLIYGVSDNIEKLKKDIEMFLSLDIVHISCYSLIIEDNTLLKINNYNYIDEDIDYNMYKYIEDTLVSKGYIHYEISNYAKKGYESLHNLNYWNNGEYYGFGLGAVSYLNRKRISNTKNLTKYLKGNYIKNSIYENDEVAMSNTVILALRTIKGLDLIKFKKRFKRDFMNVYDIEDLISDGLLIVFDNYIFINSNYLYKSNEIMMRFI